MVDLPDCMMPDGAEPCAGYQALIVERDEAQTVCDDLIAALRGIIETRGRPQPEEYVDGGASYRLAREAHECALAALAKAGA